MFNPESGPREPEEEIPQQEPPAEEGREKISDNGIDLESLGRSVKKEAGKLGDKLQEKTFYEKVVAEKQTEKITKEQQKKRKEFSGERIKRGESTRFERGQILKAYKVLRKEISEAEKGGERAVEKRVLLKEIRSRAKVMEQGLDKLEHQFDDNVTVIDVDTKYGKFSVPVTELDLRIKKDGEIDERVPYIFWGGIGGNVETNGCVMMALALAGQRVIGVPQFEQKQVKKTEGVTAAKIFKEERGFDTHAEATIGIINGLGLKRCNLIGYSTGANIALETATKMSNDEKLKGRINDLIVIEPVGLDEAGVEGLVTGLGKNVIQDMPFSEARIKVLQQAAETNATEQKLPLEPEAVFTLAKKHFSQERLNQIQVAGKMQMWGGRSSGLANMRLMEKVIGGIQQSTQEKNPNAILPQLIEVIGGTHYTPITNAMGFAREIVASREQGEQTKEPKILKRKDLANSAIKQILGDIKSKK